MTTSADAITKLRGPDQDDLRFAAAVLRSVGIRSALFGPNATDGKTFVLVVDLGEAVAEILGPWFEIRRAHADARAESQAG
jgi:hypothetical protein